MDNTTTVETVTADPAQAEQGIDAATGLGKFKDVDALLEAYTSLEAEFTRRSQRLKELERAVTEAAPAQPASQPPSPQAGQTDAPPLAVDEEYKAKIIAEYLAAAAKNRGVPLISGGVNVPARRRTPSSVSEAGALAKEFLNKRR